MKNRNHDLSRARRGRRGGILALTLVAVLAIGALTFAVVRISVAATNRQGAAVDQRQAFYLAEAGLAEAFAGLGIGKTGQVGSETSPAAYGEGLFWVDAEDLGDNRVQLESTALWGRGRVTLGLVARGTIESVASLGIFSGDDLQMNPDVTVDSFDSTLGAYATQVGTESNYQAVLGSNGDLKLLSGGEVRGDVVPGPTGSADVGSASVTGMVHPRSQPGALPEIEVPDVGPLAVLDHDDLAPLVIPAGERGFSVFDLGQNTTTLVQGPATLVVGEMTLRKGAILELDATNGPIEVFATGNVDLDLDSTVLTTLYDPTGVVFQIASGEGKAVNLGAQSTFYGFLYAPYSAVKLGAKFSVYGGLVAKSFDLATKGAVHYDVAIERRLRTLPARISWRVVDIPAALAAKGSDPYALLGVDKAELPAPSKAHADQWLVLSYLDGSGNQASYEGLESAFDWGDVTKVVELYRDGDTVTAPAEWDGGKGADPPEGEPEEGPPLSGADQAILDAILAGKSTGYLKDLVLASVPVHDDVLIAILGYTMSDGDMDTILRAHSPSTEENDNENGIEGGAPVSDAVQYAAVSSTEVKESDLADFLVLNSPLSAGVLQAVLDRTPALHSKEIAEILAAQ